MRPDDHGAPMTRETDTHSVLINEDLGMSLPSPGRL